MMSFENITDADLDVAVHADPSNDPVLWQQGAETLEEFFGPGGTFWSEPITSNGEYISEGSMSMSISSGSSHGVGGGSGNEVGIGTSSVYNIGSNVGMSSSGIGGAMNGLNIDYSSDQPPTHAATIDDENYSPYRFFAPQTGFYQQQNATYDSSPPTTQQTKHGPRKRPSPTVDIKQPTQSDKMHAELSYPITPQLGTPYVRGRTTRSTKGAEKMRREMEGQEVAETPVKASSNDPKRKKGANTPVKSSSNEPKRKKGADTPVGPRKQPKRAAKNNKK